MTNDEIREHILNYKGLAFLCGEYASELDVTWHRMKRILDKMAKANEVVAFKQGPWMFYQVSNRRSRT